MRHLLGNGVAAGLGAVLLAAGAAVASPDAFAAPYDTMQSSFGRYLDPADPSAWAEKVHAIGQDEYHFWRGTRDLFYAWCADHCRDWLADRSGYVISQGDLHMGNVGSYATRPFGTVGPGLVDFDESARLPMEIELLQCFITFDLVARQNGVDLSDKQQASLRTAFWNAYADALAHPRPLETDKDVDTLVQDHCKRPYADDLARYTQDGHFREQVTKKDGTPADVLRSLTPERRTSLAGALADAVGHDARLAALLDGRHRADFDRALLDAAERTRLDSSGSQGLSKILVLLRDPFRGVAGDGILYLKQQIPSAAERAGAVPLDGRPPAQRYVADLDALTHGRSLVASWCTWEGRSYWVSVKEPWSEDVSDKALRTPGDLKAAARVVARVLADAHSADAARLVPRLTPALRELVEDRTRAYLADEASAFAQFHADPRVARPNQ